MARISDLFERFSEESIKNCIKGKVRVQDITDIDTLLPIDLELIDFNNDGLLFRCTINGKQPMVRIIPNSEIDCSQFEKFPLVSGLFQLSSYSKETEDGTINYIPCGRGQCFDEEITIGFNGNYINSRGIIGLERLPDELKKTLVFEDSLGCYILEEIYPDKEDNKTLHGLKYAADLLIIEQKYILNKSRRKNIGGIDDFCRYRLVRYPSIEFVEENNAKAIMERIRDKATNGKALLNIWTEYSEKELEKAMKLSALFGEIRYSEGKDKADHVKELRLDLTKEQLAALKENENELKNSSFEKSSNPGARDSDTYKIKNIRKRYNFVYVEVVDEYDTLSSSGSLVFSVKGDARVKERREKAFRQLQGGKITAILRNLLFAIEGEAAEMIDLFNEGHKKAVTERTRLFLQSRFGISDLTDNQKKAVEIALNTPDIAVIQGPPGTGKSTVIAVICDRLFEEAEKEKRRKKGKDIDPYNFSKLILASAFQNDTVEHIAAKIEDKGLPTVKIGKEAMTIPAEEIVANRMKTAIYNAMQYYSARTTVSRLSKKVTDIKDEYEKEHNLERVRCSIDEILNNLDLSDELWKEWKILSRPFKHNSIKDEKIIKALRNLSTDIVSYDDNGFYEVQKLLRSGIQITEEERHELEDAPLESPTEEFLCFLSSLKKKYLNDYDTASEISIEGNNESLLNWLDNVIGYERQKEETAYNDLDTFMSANLETLYEEIEGGVSLYIRDSILAYTDSIAATNQKAGSRDVASNFQNVILEEAARSNPLDLLIPMTKALRRIILVGDHKQLPQLIENDIVDEVVETKYDDLAERDIARKKLESPLFGVLFRNLQKASKVRWISLNEQFRMHPAIGDFINSLYYEGILKAGMKDQAEKKVHGLTVSGLKDKVMVFCDVKRELGTESRGIGKSRECEAKRVISLVKEIMQDPAGKDLSIGIITFYAAQRDLIFKMAESVGFANRMSSGEYEINESVKTTRDGREKLRIGTVDSFQGKEFDVVILSATRSNTLERKENNVRKIFGFLTSENRLNVAFSRAQKLLIVCGDAEMFKDEFAQTYVKGLYEFYVNQSTNSNYGARIN